MLGIQIRCELLKSPWDWKIVTNIISTSKSLQTPNFIILFLWTTRDHIFFWFPLKESTGCLMSGVVHTPTIEIPYSIILTSSHGFFQRLDINSIQKQRMWFITLPSIPLFPKSPELPLCNKYSLLKWTHCTFTLRPPSCQRWCCHNNHSWNLWHTHHLPCIGP
jgi:hypothetical protein